jgi:hypothetical protein
MVGQLAHRYRWARLAGPFRVLVLGFLGAACGDDKAVDESRAQATDGGTFWVMYSPTPSPIPVNARFAMDVMVHRGDDHAVMLTDVDGLQVGAEMPSMGHQMIAIPTITKDPNDGSFDVGGMSLTMAGQWMVSVQVTRQNVTETAKFNVVPE